MIRRLRLLVLFAALVALPAGAGMGITGANTPHVHDSANTGGGSISPTLVTVKTPVESGAQTGLSIYQGDVNDNALFFYTGLTKTRPALSVTVAEGAVHDQSAFYANAYWDGSTYVASKGTGGNGRFAGFTLNHALYPFRFEILTGLNEGSTFTSATTVLGIKEDGTLLSFKACAAGHTRMTPNFCRRDNGVNNVLAAGTDGTCKQTTTLSGTDIKAVVGYIRATVYSANAVGGRSLTVGFFSDSGCTAQLHSESYEIYEQAATTAGSALTKKYLPLVITSSTAGQFYMKETAGNGVADFVQTGYLD